MPAITNKQQLLTQSLPLLKKKFTVGTEPSEKRSVLEEVLYAIIREGSSTPQADAAYDRLCHGFFDWNEIRVSTIQEVAEALGDLSGAGLKARRIVGFLQEVFEERYSFDLNDIAKKGLKQAAKQLARYKSGVTDFVVAWVTQRSFGGHAIPLDEPTLTVLRRLGILEGDSDDLESIRSSIEHYIPKAKGHEFVDLFVQLAQSVCTPDQPDCAQCPLKADCPTGQEQLTRAKSATKPTKPKSR
jgi:endonuclease III